jgi:hypothetical protein
MYKPRYFITLYLSPSDIRLYIHATASPIHAKRKQYGGLTQNEKDVEARYYKSSLESWMEF